MDVERTHNERVRAWVLIEATDPQRLAFDLYEEWGRRGRSMFVLVRADVVEQMELSEQLQQLTIPVNANIVIPVDAMNESELQQIIHDITSAMGDQISAVSVLRVSGHNPVPPHDAHGYITTYEVEVGGEDVKPGRQGNSPGFNAWG